ncbi:MAG: beta-propeller fold lactonase family protein [Verrucomicrobiia bacterium]|jgi:6-phosphogluconolactonase (cycloisomerase 2 family)
MKATRAYPAILSLAVLLAAGCGAGNTTVSNSSGTSTPCVPASKPESAYVLTGYAVSMFTVDSCTGQFTARTPASVGTGYSFPQNDNSEEMVIDPLGRFAYVANLVSNASSQSTISMYTIAPTSGLLTPTAPATVPTGWFPQEIAIDPLGRFVYTANTDDSTVSMFTINQTTGVLTPTTPASVSTLVSGEMLSQPNFLTVDPTGKFVYVTALLSDDATVFMYTIDQTTGLLTPTSPAMVYTGGIPFQVRVAPNGKFAYVVNNLSGGTMTDGIWQYTVNSTTGVLTSNTPVAVAAGNAPTEIAIDPTSSFAYVVNRNDNTISMFTIDPNTGNLTPNSTATIPAGTEPFRIDFDPSGKFVYVTNEGSAASIYTVNSNGTLTSAGTTGVATGGVSTTFKAVNQ